MLNTPFQGYLVKKKNVTLDEKISDNIVETRHIEKLDEKRQKKEPLWRARAIEY